MKSYSVVISDDGAWAALTADDLDNIDWYDPDNSWAILAPDAPESDQPQCAPLWYEPTTPDEWREVQRLSALSPIQPGTVAADDWDELVRGHAALPLENR